MERGVEDDHLRDGRQDVLHRADTEDVGRVVERREIAADLDLAHHVLIHDRTSGEEIGTLDDAVADGLDVLEGGKHARLRGDKLVQDELHTDFVVRNREFLAHVFLAGRLVGQDTHREADFLDETFREQVIHVVVLHVQQLVFDRIAAAVDYQNDHS